MFSDQQSTFPDLPSHSLRPVNGTVESIKSIIANLNAASLDANTEVVIAPPAAYLALARAEAKPEIAVAAQNVFDRAAGAFTGETSVAMLKDLGVAWTLTGHSERRVIIGETDEFIAKKTKFAVDNGVGAILCIGETLEVPSPHPGHDHCVASLQTLLTHVYLVLGARGRQHHEGVRAPARRRRRRPLPRRLGQGCDCLRAGLVGINTLPRQLSSVSLTVSRAIGTGKVATTSQAQEVHAEIRKWLAATVSAEVAETTRIIYGGSVTDANCKELATAADIDGFLVGGASLKPAFVDIVNAKL
ncbi:triosephosphate isomerase [Ascosphaera acerosa]|nr:triosephosphate isomerase [Ascosphaera acerosa]